MLHWRYVGHFDPEDPLDTSAKPYRPKVRRPISEEAVDRCLAAFGEDVGEFVSYEPAGYVLCNWSLAPHKLWEHVYRFADTLAQAEDAAIMSEMFIIENPPEAKQVQQAKWKQ
jgi:hypothetical protein